MLLLLVSWIEHFALGPDRPGLVEQLARGGAARDLLRLPGVTQASIEGLDGGVVLGRTERRHIERGAEAPIAAVPDAGVAADAAPRRARHRREAGVGGGLLHRGAQ